MDTRYTFCHVVFTNGRQTRRLSPYMRGDLGVSVTIKFFSLFYFTYRSYQNSFDNDIIIKFKYLITYIWSSEDCFLLVRLTNFDF